MTRWICGTLLLVSMAAVQAQVPPGASVSLSPIGGGGTTGGNSRIAVNGKITLPAGWRLANNVVTVRHQMQGSKTAYTTFPSLNGLSFDSDLTPQKGSYEVWAIVDIKAPDGREYSIQSAKQFSSVTK